MSISSFSSRPGIDDWVREWAADPAAMLLDVRMPVEYREGHIPGSRNIPLPSIEDTQDEAENLDVPIYVYCHSGARSECAAQALKELGYTQVKNIGGIAAYTGELEK